jgi:uncharacterized protein with PIN domain
MKLIPLHQDRKILQAVKRPVKIITFKGNKPVTVEEIPKTVIVCDDCNTQVATTQKEVDDGLPVGYAVCDDKYVYEVVCPECRKKYYYDLLP